MTRRSSRAIKAATFDIFVEYKSESRVINHVLWTMNVEFIGSFLVFGFLFFFAQSRFRWIAYTALTIGTFTTWYLGFVIGMMIADAYNLGWLEKLKHWSITVPMAVVAVFLGIFPKKHEGTIYEFLDLSFFGISERLFYLTISAALIILAVLLSSALTRLFQTRLLSSLGKYTFSLYLTHLLVIYTVSTSVVILLHESIGYNWAVVASALISAPVFWLVSYLFERYIDAPSIKFAKYVSAIYRGERGIDWSRRKEAVIGRIRSLF